MKLGFQTDVFNSLCWSFEDGPLSIACDGQAGRRLEDSLTWLGRTLSALKIRNE